jgi:hypothetical protein
MQLVLQIGHALLRGTCAALLIATAAPAAQANWLAELAREAGETGSKVATRAAKYGAGGLEQAAAHIKALPATAKGAALAAHATPEGHWKFVNRAGEVYTAGTPDELKRAVPTLLPDAASDAKLSIYLTEDTVFDERALLKDLPEGAALYLIAGRDSYPVVRRLRGGNAELYAAVRPNLAVALDDRGLFEEGIARLERPLSRSRIRTLALEPGAPTTLSSSPHLDPDAKAALVDAIDPGALAGALRSVRGQTVLITGRVDGNLLFFRPASGPEQSLKIVDVIEVAADTDVNLLILHASAPRQPGGRNWLWQRIAVDGLDDALKRATLADFLDALGASRGELSASIAREGSGRVVIRAVPAGAEAEPITGIVGDWLSTATSSITGNVVTSAVEVHARDEERQSELDRRIIPFIPSDYQIAYIIGLIAGVMGWPVAKAWWERIWPSESRGEYSGAAGYRAAQAARALAFVLLFLPVAGVPVLLISLVLQLWGIAALPVRAVRWITRTQAKAG